MHRAFHYATTPLLVAVAALVSSLVFAENPPLPSWNEGAHEVGNPFLRPKSDDAREQRLCSTGRPPRNI